MDEADARHQIDFDQPLSAGQEVCPACGEAVAAEDVFCPHCSELLTTPDGPGIELEQLPQRASSATLLQSSLMLGGAAIALLLMLGYFVVVYLMSR